jgi:hypothetical protein
MHALGGLQIGLGVYQGGEGEVMWPRVSCLAAVALCTLLLGCTREARSNVSVMPNQDIVVGVGTITFISLEGGFYAIRSDDGVTYDPRSLPDGFMVDALRVRFTVRVVRDAMNFHMVGPIVEVLDIRQLL